MLTVALTLTHTCQHTHIHTRTHKCRSKILLLVNKNERLNLKKTPGCKRSAQAADKGLAAWLVDPLFRPTNANCCFANKTCWCWPNPCQNILLNSNYYFFCFGEEHLEVILWRNQPETERGLTKVGAFNAEPPFIPLISNSSIRQL